MSGSYVLNCLNQNALSYHIQTHHENGFRRNAFETVASMLNTTCKFVKRIDSYSLTFHILLKWLQERPLANSSHSIHVRKKAIIMSGSWLRSVFWVTTYNTFLNITNNECTTSHVFLHPMVYIFLLSTTCIDEDFNHKTN